MKPDDEILALWVEDELDETRSREVEAWAEGEPEWLAHRAAARESKALFAKAGPMTADAPYGEFFNARIQREIELSQLPQPVPAGRTRGFNWLMPATAAAGIVLGFWFGKGATGGVDAMPAPVAELTPVLYTPEKGVDAEIVAIDAATVIVLDGVNAIPDSWELPETAMREETLLPIAHSR